MIEIDSESLAREREDRERRENDRELDAFEGAVVVVYTRAQAIGDGLLVDVSEVAKEAGLSIPTVVTRHVWEECVEVPPELEGEQDEPGRLWDVVYTCAVALRAAVRAGRTGDRLPFELLVRPADPSLRTERLLAVVGPGDTPDPVLTIEYPEDDGILRPFPQTVSRQPFVNRCREGDHTPIQRARLS
ncbi:MAG TPA: DUF6573 family protein [Thermoplasmata archaeon]|nr:DUF6573 family protein [Thermoplasmata archaeon]